MMHRRAKEEAHGQVHFVAVQRGITISAENVNPITFITAEKREYYTYFGRYRQKTDVLKARSTQLYITIDSKMFNNCSIAIRHSLCYNSPVSKILLKIRNIFLF